MEVFTEGDFRWDGGGVDAKEADQFGFEVEEGPERGFFAIEVGEETMEEIEQFGDRGLGFAGFFDEFDGVGGEEDFGVIGAEAWEAVLELGVPEGVEVAGACVLEVEFAEVEEVEDAGEAVLGAEDALGDGFDAAKVEGEPGDDEAGLGEADFSEENGWGVVHGSEWSDCHTKVAQSKPGRGSLP